jgi:hypothetical protein
MLTIILFVFVFAFVITLLVYAVETRKQLNKLKNQTAISSPRTPKTRSHSKDDVLNRIVTQKHERSCVLMFVQEEEVLDLDLLRHVLGENKYHNLLFVTKNFETLHADMQKLYRKHNTRNFILTNSNIVTSAVPFIRSHPEAKFVATMSSSGTIPYMPNLRRLVSPNSLFAQEYVRVIKNALKNDTECIIVVDSTVEFSLDLKNNIERVLGYELERVVEYSELETEMVVVENSTVAILNLSTNNTLLMEHLVTVPYNSIVSVHVIESILQEDFGVLLSGSVSHLLDVTKVILSATFGGFMDLYRLTIDAAVGFRNGDPEYTEDAYFHSMPHEFKRGDDLYGYESVPLVNLLLSLRFRPNRIQNLLRVCCPTLRSEFFAFTAESQKQFMSKMTEFAQTVSTMVPNDRSSLQLVFEPTYLPLRGNHPEIIYLVMDSFNGDLLSDSNMAYARSIGSGSACVGFIAPEDLGSFVNGASKSIGSGEQKDKAATILSGDALEDFLKDLPPLELTTGRVRERYQLW